jgi:hypothetical protein
MWRSRLPLLRRASDPVLQYPAQELAEQLAYYMALVDPTASKKFVATPNRS